MRAEGWSLREEFLSLIRKWYLVAALFAAGGALGWLAGAMIPAQYEARAALKVSFNADAIYLTPDDYKNWQMEELEDLVLSERVLAETLRRLQSGDGDWTDWTTADLRAVLTPRWRNAAAWSLVATLPDPEPAAALAGAWRQAALEQAESALEHALAFDRLDRRLDGIARELAAIETGMERLEDLHRALRHFSIAPPEGRAAQRAAELHDRLQQAPFLIAGRFPGREAPDEELAAWAAAESGRAAAAAATLADLKDGLLEEYDRIGAEWLVEKEASAGLSAYLDVSMPSDPGVQVEAQVRTGLLAFAGAVSAVLAWIAAHLVRMGMRSERGTAD